MAISSIKDPNTVEPLINAAYGYYGLEGPTSTSLSLKLGNKSSHYGSLVIDGPETDKAINSGIFAFNNHKPVASRHTTSISQVNTKVLQNMGRPVRLAKTYPGQELFGEEYSYQYIYSNNPRKDRIGVF